MELYEDGKKKRGDKMAKSVKKHYKDALKECPKDILEKMGDY